MSIISFGEILWDIIEGNPYLGGAPFNFAANIAQCGRPVAMISAVGDDDLGRRALEMAKTLKVDTAMVSVLPRIATSTVGVVLKDGQPSYTIHEGVSFDFIDRPASNAFDMTSAEMFYFGTLAQRGKKSRHTLQGLLNTFSFPNVFCDINLRLNYYNAEIVRFCFRKSTILKINDDEVKTIGMLLYGTGMTMHAFAARIANEFDIDLIVITAGEHGCYVFRNDMITHVAGTKVSVVDAVGAGDAFSAAFIHYYLNTGDELASAEIANSVGAFVAGQRGAIPEYPADLRKRLRGCQGSADLTN